MSDAKPTRLPLIATPENRDLTDARDARLINGYMEKGLSDETWCYKRPGLSVGYTPAGATALNGMGCTTWNDIVYSVFGAGGTVNFYGGATLIGAVVLIGNVSFTSCLGVLGAAPVLFFHDAHKAYVYSTGGGLIAVTDVDFPPILDSRINLVPGAVYIDGTTYVMSTDAYIYGSDLAAPLSWNPLNLIRAEIDGDLGVAIAKQQNYLVAFKTFSVEIFYDAQNAAGSPLGRMEAAKMSVGCASGETVKSIDGMLFWMSRSKQGGFGVYVMEGLKGRQISTAPVDRLLQLVDTATPGECWGYCFRAFGHRFYGLRLGSVFIGGTDRRSLIYDIDEKLWYEWQDADGTDWNVYDSTSNKYSYLQSYTTGVIWALAATFSYDLLPSGAVNFTFDLYTPNFDAGTRVKKTCNLVTIAADQVTGSVLQCRYSDDDYQTWSNFRSFDLGLERPLLSEWGTFRRRAHHLRVTDNKALRLQAVDLHLDLGTL